MIEASVTVELLMVGHEPAGEMARLVKFAEEVGYDTVWLADERFYREVYGSLAHLANHSSRVLLGPCVTDPYARHPALTAMAIATLDDISGGRAILGLGTGISGFPQLGLEARKGPTALRETIDLVGKLLSGEEVDYQGEVIRFNTGKLDFKPLRSRIPVHVASNGPLGQRVAGAMADVAIMAGAGSFAEVRTLRKEVDRGSVSAGRKAGSVTLTARLNTCISTDGRAARDAVRLSAARYVSGGPMRMATLEQQGLTLPQEVLAQVANIPYMAGLKPYAPALPYVTDRHVDACTLAGTRDEVIDHVLLLLDAGVSSFIIVPFAPAGGKAEDTIVSFATEVWPAVAARRGQPS